MRAASTFTFSLMGAMSYALPGPSPSNNTSQLLSTSGFTRSWFHPSKGGLAICVSGIIPVQATTDKNLIFNITAPSSQWEVTQLILDHIITRNATTADIIKGTQEVSGLFDIAGTLCTPVGRAEPTTVQFLSHGVGLEGQHWDFAQGYSFVDIAAKAGYATFYYDRLGVGKSS